MRPSAARNSANLVFCCSRLTAHVVDVVLENDLLNNHASSGFPVSLVSQIVEPTDVIHLFCLDLLKEGNEQLILIRLSILNIDRFWKPLLAVFTNKISFKARYNMSVSSLNRGHVNLPYIVPILADDP